MPPGNDALAQAFSGMRELIRKNPKMSEDLTLMRGVMGTSDAFASEPTEVMYADEPDLAFLSPSLWCIPVAAKDSPNVILYFHGGGFMTGSPHSHRKMAGHLAKASGVKLLSIDYRTCPEHKFPAQLEDAVTAYKWLLSKGYKAVNIATMGDSAGGNLSTSVVLKLRDLGEPLPKAIVPISPWYDMFFTGGTIDSCLDTDALIARESLKMTVDAFINEKDKSNPLAHVLDADPKGLPPMYIIAGGYETLLDNATKFADKAKKAGVDVTIEIGEKMQHVYTFMAGKNKTADESIANIGKWLSAQFKS